MYAAARKEVKLSRAVAAQRLHIGERTLARYELGEVVPPADVIRGMVRVYKRPDLVRKYCSRFCPLGSEWQKCCQALKYLGLYDRMQLVVERMDTEEGAEKGTATAQHSDRTGVRGPR